MPCSSDGYGPSEREIWGGQAFPVACELSKILTPDQHERLSPLAVRWIAQHEKYDLETAKQRAANARHERLRLDGLAKLSQEEKVALGIGER